jgi:glycyl-radical enzyme activating protein
MEPSSHNDIRFPESSGKSSKKEERSGLIGGIQRFSTSDGPGIRTTVFLKGCPLSCQWCHNPELISQKRQLMRRESKCIHCGYCIPICPSGAIHAEKNGLSVDFSRCIDCFQCTDICTAEAMQIVGEWKTSKEVIETVIRDQGFYEKSGGGLTISGGELLMQSEFAESLIDLARMHGISTALDTSGFGSGEILLRLARKADWVLYDMKCINPEGHKKYTGKDNALILANLRLLASDKDVKKKIWMRMPLVHGVNDSEEIITTTANLYRELQLQRVTIMSYHELGINKCKGIGRPFYKFTPPDHARMLAIRDTFARLGMEAEILGEDIG